MRQFGQRFCFPRPVLLDQFEHTWIQHEEAAVDHAAFAVRFFLKTSNSFAIDFECSKSPRWRYGTDGRSPAVIAMELDRLGNIDVGDAIAIREAERLIVVDEAFYRLQAAPGHSVFAGIDQGHAPRFGVPLVNFHPVIDHVEGDVGSV